MNKKMKLAIIVVILAIGVSLIMIALRDDEGYNSVPVIRTNTSSTSQNDSLPTGPSGVSLEDLSKHNSTSDCWVLFKGKVYDLTSFLPNHPGTPAAIAPYCGNEGFEEAFTKKHGTTKISALMKFGVLMGDFKIVGKTA